MAKKRKKLRAVVQRVITPALPEESEKAEIDIEDADDLYREIRVENVLTDEDGKTGRLEEGDEVDVNIEADGDSKKKSA